MLRPEFARSRQQRLLEIMHRQNLDAVVVGTPRLVYYFTTHWTHWLQQSGLVLFSDGRSTLVTANTPSKTAIADDIQSYEAQWMSTQRTEQPAYVAEKLSKILRSRQLHRIGYDSSGISSHVIASLDYDCLSIDADLWQLRRRKDPDELELLQVSIRCTEAMYARAREIVRPGAEELDVYADLHSVAVKTAGEPLSDYLGNDFACAVPGGPPRANRAAQAGEIYILDLGPAYRGYFADNCRSFSVDRNPTDLQLKAHAAIVGAFPIVESLAKPGARCKEIFAAVHEHLKQSFPQGLVHHLGHGVGLYPHEFPHLNPKWDDVLIEGDFFTAEPGIYSEELRGGIRIENNYLVTSNGVKNLLNFPMDLA